MGVIRAGAEKMDLIKQPYYLFQYKNLLSYASSSAVLGMVVAVKIAGISSLRGKKGSEDQERVSGRDLTLFLPNTR